MFANAPGAPQAQPLPPVSAPVPPSSGPGTAGGILGDQYGKGGGTERTQEQQQNMDAYRASGLAQKSLEEAQQASAQAGRTPGDNARGGANGGNSGGGRNNPESSQASPGSGGSGSFGRCFVLYEWR